MSSDTASSDESDSSDREYHPRGTASYYVKNIDISVSPIIGERVEGMVAVEIEMRNPEIDRDMGRFLCNCDLFIELYSRKAEKQSSHEVPDEADFERVDFGDVEVEMKIVLDPDFDEDEEIWFESLEVEIEKWHDEGYESVDSSLQFQLESEILSEILIPISQLLDEEFSGVVPRILFRRPEDAEEEDSQEGTEQDEGEAEQDSADQ